MRNRLYSSSPYNDDGGEEVTTMRERSDWGDVVIMHRQKSVIPRSYSVCDSSNSDCSNQAQDSKAL